MSEAKQRCKKRVYGNRHSFAGDQCSRLSKDGCGGFCSIHYPPNVEAKNAALRKKWDGEMAARKAERDETRRACDEMAHKASCFDDLLAALKEIVALTDRKTDIWDKAHAAIAKAEGRTS